MKRIHPKLRSGVTVLAMAALPLAVSQALAAEYWLQTGTTTVQTVPMWGYQKCTDASFSVCDPVRVPGPELTVAPGDPGLTIHLKNMLPKPTSLVINGQTATMRPVWVEPDTVKGVPNPNAGTVYAPADGRRPAGNLTAVVRSFTAEAATGETVDYVWPGIKPGTYLYQSGTHPQVQVQMGLYGALTKDTDAGNIAYRQGAASITYSNQRTLVYSEVDPALHQAVVDGSYGTTGPSSTLEYRPKFFLINGVSYPHASLAPIATVPAAQPLLLRFLNAGLKTHVPTIEGQYWKMIAEDGNPYPYLNNPRQQYTAFLTAGKTLDVLLTPTNPGTTRSHAIYDSRAFDTNSGAQGGGMLAYLEVAPGTAANGAPVFDSAPPTTGTAGVAYGYQPHATDPDGDAVTYALVSGPVGMTMGSGGLVTWPTPTVGTSGVSITASDLTHSVSQNFNIVVTAANQPPVAVADGPYTAVAHPASSGITQTVAAPGVLANDTDPDGNALHTTAAVIGRVTLAANGSFTLAPGGTGSVIFAYNALDTANASSTSATVTINVIANRAPTAVADSFSAPRWTGGPYTPVVVNLANNDTDPDTATLDSPNQLPLVAARVRRSTGSGTTNGTINTAMGSVTINAGGVVAYTPRLNSTGNDSFQYRVKDKLGRESANWATVSIRIQ